MGLSLSSLARSMMRPHRGPGPGSRALQVTAGGTESSPAPRPGLAGPSAPSLRGRGSGCRSGSSLCARNTQGRAPAVGPAPGACVPRSLQLWF